MALLELQDVTVTAGDAVLIEDVSMQVDEGELVALIGPNGAGKTTLLRAVAGLMPVRSGAIRLFGKPRAELGRNRSRIGYVPQRLELDRSIPVTVHEFMRAFGPKRLSAADSCLKVLREVRAEELHDRRLGLLSGGELQRVLIAANLVHEPSLLLLDEPATGIDPEGEQRFYDLLDELRRAHAMSVLMVSHDISVVYRFASRVLCINKRLLCAGLPTDVLNDTTLHRLYGHATAVFEHRHA